jgi:filamin
VRVYGPGVEPHGLVAKAPAKFIVETFGAGDGEVRVEVLGPRNESVSCSVTFNNDRKKTYACSYFPEEEGHYVVKVFFAGREVPKSPFKVSLRFNLKGKSLEWEYHPVLSLRNLCLRV